MDTEPLSKAYFPAIQAIRLVLPRSARDFVGFQTCTERKPNECSTAKCLAKRLSYVSLCAVALRPHPHLIAAHSRFQPIQHRTVTRRLNFRERQARTLLTRPPDQFDGLRNDFAFCATRLEARPDDLEPHVLGSIVRIDVTGCRAPVGQSDYDGLGRQFRFHALADSVEDFAVHADEIDVADPQ